MRESRRTTDPTDDLRAASPSVTVPAALLAAAALVLAAPGAAHAQGHTGAGDEDSPVVSSLVSYMEGKAADITGAARQMPAEHWGFSPTEDLRPFRGEVAHVIGLNFRLCGGLSGRKPEDADFSHDAPKDELVALLERSFAFCRTSLGSMEDADLAATMEMGGGARPKAGLAFFLVGAWADHYGHMAAYMRMNGLTPPSAQ